MPTRERGPAYEKLVDEERIILDVTEALSEQMSSLGLNSEEVAAAARIPPDELRHELEGSARMNLRKLIRVAAVLGLELRLARRPGAPRRPRP